MNWRKPLCVVALLLVSGAFLLPAIAAPSKPKVKEYQVTGPVLAVTDNVVTVQKGEEKWDLEVSSDTKMDGKLAVGQKVTIYYHMVANRVEKKADGEKKDKGADAK